MATLNELANQAKREIKAGDASVRHADDHYKKAGKALIAAKAKVKHGEWLPWLKKNVAISERRARELMELGEGKKTVEGMRERKQESVRETRAKSALRSADLDFESPAEKRAKPTQAPGACDFDWSNVKEGDFGNPTKAYKAQAAHYRRDATMLAETYPLLSAKVDAEIITEIEIQAARKVAQAWSEVAEKLARRKAKAVA